MKFGFCVIAAAALAAGGAAGLAGRGDAQTVAPSGEAIFKQRCAACHTIAKRESSRVGPNLAGIVGRKGAAQSFNYSPALKAAKLTWTKVSLDRYLTAPAKMVPGTRMAVVLPDAQQRAAVIAYLEKAK